MLLSLPQTQAHLWYLTSEGKTARDLREAAHRLISAEELARSNRFVSVQARDTYLTARVLVRCVLSQYIEVDPQSWTFASGTNGKPEIMAPVFAQSLRFNLSHTDGLLTCLIAHHRNVGVDTEAADRSVDIDAIADRFLAPSKSSHLRALSALERRQRFFELWTLRESYLKARGVGMSMPLDKFSIVVGRKERIRIVFDTSVVDDFENWCFSIRQVSKRHLVSVAFDRLPAEKANDWRQAIQLIVKPFGEGDYESALRRVSVEASWNERMNC